MKFINILFQKNCPIPFFMNFIVGNIEKMNGQIKSITINNKKYVNSDLLIVY